jgi:hypothetical protein
VIFKKELISFYSGYERIEDEIAIKVYSALKTRGTQQCAVAMVSKNDMMKYVLEGVEVVVESIRKDAGHVCI